MKRANSFEFVTMLVSSAFQAVGTAIDAPAAGISEALRWLSAEATGVASRASSDQARAARPTRRARHSQRFKRKKPIIADERRDERAEDHPERGVRALAREEDVHPEDAVISVSGSIVTLMIVSRRSTSFWRCEMTDSFVDSSASTTSL